MQMKQKKTGTEYYEVQKVLVKKFNRRKGKSSWTGPYEVMQVNQITLTLDTDLKVHAREVVGIYHNIII